MKSKAPHCQNKSRRYREISLQMSTLMDGTDINLDDFINAIRFNSELSSTIIEIVNRNFSGFTGEINCISRAVKMIGIGQLYRIVSDLSDPVQQHDEYYLEAASNNPGKNKSPGKLKQVG